ncbi:PRP38-domain-containing protein [Testicularia cyperi]|uniref:Pre-mRNA-splicing factor 38 n=1 Tax=Testicularia cyperi TaxID=1882483 RepID=A0A317XJP7_9BASI|nr:PRP38-domain-containing protein [Testicularia cyperi]
MANATIRGAKSIHGTNPQFLIEKVVRTRIYESPYWKEHCFALSAASILDRAVSLDYVGGLTGLQRPSPFLCLLQKLLQIQPEREIIDEYLGAKEFKYLRALVAFYIRLTASSTDVYELLEPMLQDYRKLRWRGPGGDYYISHMDEFIDELLREERVCDIILPRLTKRDICEARDGLLPRISKLEDALFSSSLSSSKMHERKRDGDNNDSEDGDDADSDDSQSDARRWKLRRLKQAAARRQARLAQEQAQPSHSIPDEEYTSQEEEEESNEEDAEAARSKRRRFISPTPSVSPDRLRQQGPRYMSRSPSRSPDRDPDASVSHHQQPQSQPQHQQIGYTSRSPSRSPDRDPPQRPRFQSRSPSRSPDRQ